MCGTGTALGWADTLSRTRCQGIRALGQPWRAQAWGEEGRGGGLWEGGRWLTLSRHRERRFCFLVLPCPSWQVVPTGCWSAEGMAGGLWRSFARVDRLKWGVQGSANSVLYFYSFWGQWPGKGHCVGGAGIFQLAQGLPAEGRSCPELQIGLGSVSVTPLWAPELPQGTLPPWSTVSSGGRRLYPAHWKQLAVAEPWKSWSGAGCGFVFK